MDKNSDAGQCEKVSVNHTQAGSGSAYFWDFGWALMKMRTGKKVFRSGWNGKGMWLCIQHPDLNSKMGEPYVYMHTTRNRLVPWTPSQLDIMACDWEVVRE